MPRRRGFHHGTWRIQTLGHRTFPWVRPSGQPATGQTRGRGVGEGNKDAHETVEEERTDKNIMVFSTTKDVTKCNQIHACLVLYGFLTYMKHKQRHTYKPFHRLGQKTTQHTVFLCFESKYKLHASSEQAVVCVSACGVTQWNLGSSEFKKRHL